MTTNLLKMIALVLMLVDHIGEFIPGVPVWFRWLGRISSPLFMFCMAWGFYYTHNRKIYLVRLYLFGVFMGALGFVLNILPNKATFVSNNIFVTLFMVGLCIYLIEEFKENKRKAILYIVLFLAVQVVSTLIIPQVMMLMPVFGQETMLMVASVLPNIIYCEGGIIFVALGVTLYYTKKNKKNVAIAYLIFCALFFVISYTPDIEMLLFINYQWMMIAALPLMLCYNNQKGGGSKYFFYIFYPAHIAILSLIGNFIASK